jgi:hypothetical protein
MDTPEAIIKKKYRIQYVMDNNIDHHGDSTDYCNYFEIEVFTDADEPGNPFKTVAKADFAKFSLTKALKDDYSMLDFFDMNLLSYSFGKHLFDFDTHKMIPESFKMFNSKNGSDILLLDNLELLPEVRGTGLGHFMIKDIYARFSSGCQMMILNAKSSVLISEHDHWTKSLALEKLAKDPEFDKYKLFAYCQKLGFQNHFNDQLFFLDAAAENKQMEVVNLEEYLV